MARVLNSFAATVDQAVTTLTVQGFAFDQGDPSPATDLHTEPIPAGRVDYSDWTRRVEAAGFVFDGGSWHKGGPGHLVVLAAQQPAVA